MGYGGLTDIAFFANDKTSPVMIRVLLTNANNTATSQFTLKNCVGVVIGGPTPQDSKASFLVDLHTLQASNPCVVELSALPVSQDSGNITVCIEAFQDGAALKYSSAGSPASPGPAGVSVGSTAPGTNCGSVITLL